MAKDGKDTGAPEDTAAERYNDELLSASWNPVIGLLEWSCARTLDEASRSHTPQVREEDADDFLGRIYSSGA